MLIGRETCQACIWNTFALIVRPSCLTIDAGQFTDENNQLWTTEAIQFWPHGHAEFDSRFRAGSQRRASEYLENKCVCVCVCVRFSRELGVFECHARHNRGGGGRP